MDKSKKLEIYKNLEKKSFKDLYNIYYKSKRNYITNENKKSLLLMKVIEKIIDSKSVF